MFSLFTSSSPTIARFWAIFLGGLVVFCWSYYNVLVELTSIFDNAFILAACVILNTIFITPLFLAQRKHYANAFFGKPGERTSKDSEKEDVKLLNNSSNNDSSICDSGTVVSTWSQLTLRRAGPLVVFGFIDASLIILMSYAFQHINIGDASCLFALRVIWTPIFEAIGNRRCLAKGQILVGVMSLIGATLITQPVIIFGEPETESDSTSSAGQQTLAFFSALVAGMLAGMSYIFIAFCPEVHWVVWQSMIVPLGWIIAPVNYLIVNGVWTPTGYTAGDVIKIIFIALFDLFGRFCRTLAVQEDVPDAASLVALVSVLEIPFTYFWGWLFAGQNLGLVQFIGAMIVVASVVLLSIPALWEEVEEEGEKKALMGSGSGDGDGKKGGTNDGRGVDGEENESTIDNLDDLDKTKLVAD